MKVIGIGVMLQTSTGTYLLQERDNNAPLHPGRIAPFGGGIENDEDAILCARREMFEELNLNLDVDNLSTIQLFESRYEPEVFIHMFLAKDVDKSSLVLQEGRAIVEMTKEEAMENKDVTDFTKEVLNLL
jgi:8-oxo-dGTP pyrophosphatase MutT (NUDIX family)